MENAETMKNPPTVRFHDNYRAAYYMDRSYIPIFLPPAPLVHIFVVTENLIQMVMVKGLFVGLLRNTPTLTWLNSQVFVGFMSDDCSWIWMLYI